MGIALSFAAGVSGTVKTRARALVTPMADFWLVGGLSLVMMAAALVMQRQNVALPMTDLSWLAFYLAFVVNNPHFAHSYQIFYESFVRHMRDAAVPLLSKLRFVVAGVVAPLVLAGYFLTAYMLQSAALMGWAVEAMYFFVGWHYVKQGYGVLITLSVYKGIFYTTTEKAILIVNAYVVWLYGWTKVKGVAASHFFYDLPYLSRAVPDYIVDLMFAAVLVTSVLAVGVFIFGRIFGGRSVSLNGLTGYVSASYIWTVFPYVSPLFFLFVPLFHSLQYLPFVWRYQAGRIKEGLAAESDGRRKRFLFSIALFIVTGIGLGAVFMDLLPKQIDQAHGALSFSQNFFLISAILFINIHHYFIDHAFWRRDNAAVRKYIFDR